MKIMGLLSSCRKSAFIVLACGILPRSVLAQCPNVQAVYRTASASASKCGFTELCGDISTPPKYYLQSQIVYTGSASGNSCFPPVISFESASYNKTVTDTYNSQDCLDQVSYSGNANLQWESSSADGNCGSESLSASIINSATGAWSDGSSSTNAYNSATNYIADASDGYGSPATTSQCISMMKTSDTYSSGEVDFGYGNTFSWVQDMTGTTTLTSEFTDAMLRSKVMSMPSLQSFSPWKTNSAAAFGSAFYSLDTNHYNASAQKMEYFFHISDCQPHTSYSVTWDQITTYPNNSTPSVEHMQEDIEGTGDPAGTDGSTHTVDVPGTPSTITEQNIKVEYAPWDGAF